MRRPIIAIASAALLSACSTTQHSPPNPSLYPASFLARPPAESAVGPFWTQFEDPALIDLLRQADANNGDIRQAVARVAQARALVRGARAAQLPEIGASTNAQQRRNSAAANAFGPRDFALFDAGFDASWELDLFGRLGAEARANAQDAVAAEFDSKAVRITVAAETARLYFAVQSLRKRLDLVMRSASAQAELAQLAQSRAAAGLSPATDAIQAEGLAASALARAADLRAQYADTLAALGLIVGRTAVEIAPLIAVPAGLTVPRSPMLGTPADVLTRRPDVARDIARLAAADARTAARVRDRLPRLTLSSTVGTSATAVGTLFSPAATISSAAAGVVAPIIDFGRRKAIADQAAAQADERAAIVQTMVLTAIREIERDAAAVTARTAENRQKIIELERNRTAHQLLRHRYVAGLQDFTGILDAERQALASAEAELISREVAVDAAIVLWKSVGGQ